MDVNQVPIKLPDSWQEDPILRRFGEDLVWVVYQLRVRSGGDTDSTLENTLNISINAQGVSVNATNISEATYKEFVSGGGLTNLPAISGEYQRATIKNIGTTDETLATPDGSLIEGSSTALLCGGCSFTLANDLTNWYIV